MKNLALHILDILQNSITAGATLIELIIDEHRNDGMVYLEISDNGCGMAPSLLARVTDPYVTSRTTRNVGLGLPLLKLNADQAGGSFTITSAEGAGTSVQARFAAGHPDTPPMGDITGVIILTICSNISVDFLYIHRSKTGEYRFDTREVKEMLDDVPLDNNEVRRFLSEMLRENLEAINAGESLVFKELLHQNR
jgi:hypothetical protein